MKRVLINVFIVIGMMLLGINANASTSLGLNLESNKREIKSQDEVILTLKTTRSVEVDKIINVYKVTIEYDKTIFEEITNDSFRCQNSWSNLKYNKDNNQVIVINKENSNQFEEVLKLHLKVKEDVNKDQTSIKIKDIITSYGEYDISVKSQEITFKVLNSKEESNLNYTNKTAENNKINQSNESGDENKSDDGKNNITDVLDEEESSSDFDILKEEYVEDKSDKIEKETSEDLIDKVVSFSRDNNLIIYIVLFLVILVSIIFFIKKKIINMKMFTLLLLISGITMIQFKVLAATIKTGDINNDSVINISDVEILEEVLVELKDIPNKEVADINNNNKVSITDLSLLIKQISEKPIEEKNTKTAQQAVQEMKIGWNLGNSLDSCDYQKKHSITYYETHWGNPVTTKSMIDEIKKAGFNSVRVPVTYYDHINDDGIIDKEWLDRVEEVVNYVLDNNMYCIMDIHHDTGLYQGGSWIRADADKYVENAQKLSDIWKQIAVRFKDYDYKLVFEGFNEIVDTNKNYDWTTGYNNTITVNKLNQVFVDTVRQTGGKNSDRFLAVSTFGAITDEQKLSTFVMPKDVVSDKIILALHDYSNTTAGIDKMLARIEKYCVRKNIPVILDEFGTTSSISVDQRVEIANYYVSKAKKIGITCFWWDNGGTYQLFNRRNMNWAYPKIKDALISGANQI